MVSAGESSSSEAFSKIEEQLKELGITDEELKEELANIKFVSIEQIKALF